MSAVPAKTSPSPGYDIGRPHGQCARCAQIVQPGQTLFAALREIPGGFERLDLCPACWEKFDRADLAAFWRTTLPHPDQKKKTFVDDEILATLFQRLAQTTEPAKLDFRFVLGLILMRKRLLIYDSTRHEADREIWIVRLKGQEEPLELLNPRLDEQKVQLVSQQLSEILNEEL